ncbi:uncharacterized protein LAJ45_02478 [Morchella importuna]|uniref:uncharacterized protein n=1 Tax=Morchella importuna TaxID=1174673 RepID=UPI001E8E35E3|nr:uncharacterized protein LAJ45_02478 [Morchella importuna]KAH8153665.1 hypothetical protein LAJ45_02478 [Morchella importuna]
MASSSSSTALCTSCTEPLIISVEDEDTPDQSAGIIDDIELPCGHHYHWSCFAEEYTSGDSARSQCPSCSTSTLDSATGKLLVTYRNEGGIQTGLDLEFCAEGDVESVLEMIEMDAELLDAQDFETGQTGLHVAVQNQREDVIQLLLEKGVDRAVLDNAGRNYYQLAVELGADEVQLQRLKGR